MLKLYCAESLVDGQMLTDFLNNNGVPAMLFNQNASGALGELPVSYPEVWIRRDLDLERAERLLDYFFDDEGIDLTWRCRACGEANPESFEICWKCREPSPVD